MMDDSSIIDHQSSIIDIRSSIIKELKPIAGDSNNFNFLNLNKTNNYFSKVKECEREPENMNKCKSA